MLDRTGIAREMKDPIFGIVQCHEKTKKSTRNKGSTFHFRHSLSIAQKGKVM